MQSVFSALFLHTPARMHSILTELEQLVDLQKINQLFYGLSPFQSKNAKQLLNQALQI